MKKYIFLLLQCCLLNSIYSQDYIHANWNLGKDSVDIIVYQTNTPENIIYTVPEEVQKGVFSEPLNYLDQLIEHLVSWTNDNFLKVKSIHDWIVCNIPYDVEAYNNREIKIEQPWITLRFRTAVCGGYAKLFEYMVKKAGFECYYVSGYTKGRGIYTIQPVGVFVRHAWNCVKINDIWYLVDTTWNAGYVNSNKFTFLYSTKYFLADPSIFIKRHYPQSPGFQLLDEYVSINDFRNM